MKVHHLNSGTMRPFGGRLVTGRGSFFHRGELVCHTLVLETDSASLVLVDTGLGLDDVRTPKATLPLLFRVASRPVLDERETTARQLAALGLATSDVRHVALTHLDVDHAGGVRDFPGARVHVLREELDDRANPRYSPAQWRDADLVPHDPTGETWAGFEGVRELLPDVLLVPLVGHTRGHTGVAVRTGDGWLLHAGDAYFHHGQLATPPHIPVGLAGFERRMQTIAELRLANLARLREVADRVTVVNAHDAAHLRRFAPAHAS
ncbi:MBL fold metallo-hydrolase [Saccharothrix longispora]|uniref:Glyoxylase-like metal-dependent hydrolase (Beta-lactamase superfamily II) n=1 Tax=Saccharothrix longispora TaxID=33920 RepID=A0ABU1Q667_9PSEU|nr:MBL fold metallo-hydrolase [Saccharothrix longispora]MDR6597909.1 glyoxylase-like metal-dependent hydrolase (beta-lactamase superfamily II) [Saccharothrix longispora]